MPAKLDYTAYQFDTAILPPKFTICGVRLLPFCLGHFLLLRQLNNPIIEETPKEVTFQDGIYWFFNALLICGLSFEDNIELLCDEKLMEKTYHLFTTNLLKNIESEPSWNLFEKLTLFKSYMNYHMDMPLYTEENKPAKDKAPSGIDWTQNIYVTFKKLGYKESEILNMNFRKLFYEWTSHAESEGAITVWNKQNLDQLARAKGLL